MHEHVYDYHIAEALLVKARRSTCMLSNRRSLLGHWLMCACVHMYVRMCAYVCAHACTYQQARAGSSSHEKECAARIAALAPPANAFATETP